MDPNLNCWVGYFPKVRRIQNSKNDFTAKSSLPNPNTKWDARKGFIGPNPFPRQGVDKGYVGICKWVPKANGSNSMAGPTVKPYGSTNGVNHRTTQTNRALETFSNETQKNTKDKSSSKTGEDKH